jgi:phosphoglucomutase
MAAANGVRRIWVGLNGLLSTPAVSAVIRERVGADVSHVLCNLLLFILHSLFEEFFIFVLSKVVHV